VTIARTLTRAGALIALPAALAAQQKELPLKHAPQPTSPAITAGDLMTRLYIFADDSMEGRETGTPGHVRSTQYIADELKKLGLVPAGDEGTFFQNVPMVNRALDPATTIAVGGTTLTALTDFATTAGRGMPRSIDGAQVVHGGVFGDTVNGIAPAETRGKVVLFRAPTENNFRIAARVAQRYPDAAAIATVIGGGELPQNVLRAARATSMVMKGPGERTPLSLTITEHAADVLLGAPFASASVGQAGKTISGDVRFTETPVPARNVVAILPGADAKLKGQFVAFGAHNDHIGVRRSNAAAFGGRGGGGPVDHDSLHLYNAARYAIVGMVPRGATPSAEQQAKVAAITINLDSVRKLRPARVDSINNGADDDGSGSVTLLEVAEAYAKSAVRPKRSLLFVWHTGEEKGLLGSRWVTDHLPVPADSVVAQLNMDMVGRGAARDIPGGGDEYLQLVGSRRLSTELGDLVEAVNAKERKPFKFDYQFDANGHPENIYCRSDHYNYARIGIPITFFTTGLHGDYHQVTDEPQYIDYPHMARVGQLVYDIGLRVANLDHRVVVDKPKPDPNGRCQQ
jgi:peptidase M28-like protein